jgi:hypothetical protein
LVVCPAIKASLTVVVTIYHHCIRDHITPNIEGAEKSEKLALEDSIFLPVGFKDCIMSQDNCFEKNFTGLSVGSKSTAPMPEKVPLAAGSYDASV